MTHKRKLHSIGIDSSLEPVNPNKVIFNYSTIQLPERIRFLLAFGLEFCLPVFKLDYFKYFLSFKRLAYTLQQKQSHNFKTFNEQLKCLAFKYFYNFKPFKVFSAIISFNDISLLKNFSLKYRSKIFVCKPDKGKGVVIVDRDKYVNSLTEIVSHSSKFSIINDNIKKFTVHIEDKINNFLGRLKI